ncbi:hypothetical protein CVS40_12292 [Lucilia cuprina]|nr:hypothetical protein CVS40_12292 [Lucilia cuprina]
MKKEKCNLIVNKNMKLIKSILLIGCIVASAMAAAGHVNVQGSNDPGNHVVAAYGPYYNEQGKK